LEQDLLGVATKGGEVAMLFGGFEFGDIVKMKEGTKGLSVATTEGNELYGVATDCIRGALDHQLAHRGSPLPKGFDECGMSAQEISDWMAQGTFWRAAEDLRGDRIELDQPSVGINHEHTIT
jgi:hypothetical protein